MHNTLKYINLAVIALLAVSCVEGLDDPYGSSGNYPPVVIPESILAQIPVFESDARSSHRGGLLECEAESWGDDGTVSSRTYAEPDESTFDKKTGEYGEYFQYWSEGDAISLFLTNSNLRYVMGSYTGGERDRGEFVLDGDRTEGSTINTNYYYSVYPYKESTIISPRGKISYEFPSLQHYSGDSYANGENGMVAIEPKDGTDSVLYFQNFCSYLQLRLVATENQTQVVKKITLIANDTDDFISGISEIEIRSRESGPVVTMKQSASNQITLDCGSGVELSNDKTAPTKFWFVLPGDITFTKGFSISVAFADHSYFNKSTQNSIHIERSHIKPMATFEPDDIMVPNEPIRYKYNDPTNTEPFPLANTFFGEGGVVLDVLGQTYDEKTGEWVVLLSGTLKTVGDNSFEGPGPDLEYIKISNGEDSVDINNFAFFNCTADSLVVYSPVNSIGESAFSSSTIKEVNIYSDVNTINTGVASSSVLESIKITGNVGVIDDQAFSGTASLQSINIEGSIGTIGVKAFYGCPVEVFDVGGNIDTIEQQAFCDLDALRHLNIEGNVNIVGEQAFYDCDGMTDIHIHGDIDRIESQAFYRCDRLEKVEILGHLEYIGQEAFTDCDKLKSVDIKEGVDVIGINAFSDCDELEIVHVDGDIQTIDKRAFHDCDKLQSVDIEGNIGIIGEEAFALSDELSSVSIVGNIGTIGQRAFYDCDGLESVEIVGDITTISTGAFSLCDTLKAVNITGDIETIAREAFLSCHILQNVDINGSVNTIDQQVFVGCDSLKTIEIDNVETIGYRAFYGCANLTEVKISGIKYLGMGAFRGCTSLQTITLDSVVTIDDNAFYDCSALTSVIISEYCTMIGEGAFCNAAQLQEVYCYAVNPPFIKTDNDKSSYAFAGVHKDIRIYIPLGSYDAYSDVAYFKGQTFADSSIKAEINWWYQEYDFYLVDMPAN